VKNLKTCPACKGEKMVTIQEETDAPWMGFKKHPREPCTFCNGTGIVSPEKYDTYHGEVKSDDNSN